MKMYELDSPGDDDHVGTLYFPDVSATLGNCAYSFCNPTFGSFKSPNSGHTHVLTAKIGVRLRAYYYDEQIYAANDGYFEALDRRSSVVIDSAQTVNAEASSHNTSTFMRREALDWIHSFDPAPLRSGKRSAGYAHSASVKSDSVPEGEVVGSVLDSANGLPLSDATVATLVETENGYAIRVVTPDDSGIFRLRDLKFGIRNVVAFAAGYGRSRASVKLVEGRGSVVALALPKGAIVSGIVRDATGSPEREATVDVVYLRHPDLPATLPRIASAEWHRIDITDPTGDYLVGDIDAGVRLRLVATTPDGRTGYSDTLVLAPGETRKDVEIALSR